MSIIGGINFGSLTDYLFFFANGSSGANWQSASKGFLGDVAVNGVTASETTSGTFAYAGTISTNDITLSAWQNIVNNNPGQAFSSLNKTTLINDLKADLVSAIQQINALPVTPGYNNMSILSLNGLNTQNGINETFVINITQDLSFTSEIKITGDPGDVFILRWDTDGNPNNGYQGQLKPHSGGAIVPLGGLTPTNFINVAGDITSSGGGSNPAVPYPQGPRYNNGTGALITNGANWNGGGFFTGFLLTTGAPGSTPDPVTGLYIGKTASLSNGIFVGGWYSLTTDFSMTSGTSGVYVTPNPETISQPGINVQKFVSPDSGVTWMSAETAPGPNISSNVQPQFKFVVTNTGNVPLSLVSLSDSVYGPISVGGNLPVGASFEYVIIVPWSEGAHENEATATGTYLTETVTSSDLSHYVGVQVQVPEVSIIKYVSPDNGITWLDGNTPPGPDIFSNVQPQFKFVVTNTGNEDLTNVVVVDDKYGFIGSWDILQIGESEFFIYTANWESGLQVNTASVTTDQGVTDENSAYYTGVLAVPGISVKKYVSPDNGLTWFDAETPTGPVIYSDVSPQFEFVVTNTGNVPLTQVTVTDSVYGVISVGGNLDVGASFGIIIIRPWSEGQHENQAVATGSYGAETASASDLSYYLGVQVPAPAIKVTKYVSADNGVTWVSAQTAPGPNISSNVQPQFKFVVTNTGNVPLSLVSLTDSVYGPISLGGNLPVGASFESTIIVPWSEGPHENEATVTGTYGTDTVTSSDLSHYVGVQVEIPGVSIVKYVSPDNGVTWLDADTPPGPDIFSNVQPQFQFVVTNTGNVDLTNVVVMDDIFGVVGSSAMLPVGQTEVFFYTASWAEGLHVNTATVITDQGVTDENSAYYNGVLEVPGISVKKYVSPDNGLTWFDAETPTGPVIYSNIQPQFEFVVTNTGNVPLTQVTLTDSVYGVISLGGNLGVGDSFTTVIIKPWSEGQHENHAIAAGNYGAETVLSSDPCHYLGVQVPNPTIIITKYVSADNGATWVDASIPPGPIVYFGTSPKFRFVVTNIGNVSLTDVTVTDNVYGLVGTLPNIDPGDSYEWVITGSWQEGQHENIATVNANFDGEPLTPVTDNAWYNGERILEPSISITKYVSVDNGLTWIHATTSPGPLLPVGMTAKFKYVVLNNGNMPLTNVTITDSVLGVIVSGISLAIGEEQTFFA